MDSDLAYKNRIGQRLTKILVDAYEKQQLPQEQVSYLAGVIRERLAQAKTSNDVLMFVDELAKEWDIFASVISDPNRPIIKNVHRRWLEQIAK